MEKQPLHDVLCDVIGMPFPNGENHCYFEPPADIFMNYPCFVYDYANDIDIFADNKHYQSFKTYTVTLIDEDPDSEILKKMKELLYCSLDRHFVVDGLHHFVYTLYYNGPRIKEEM